MRLHRNRKRHTPAAIMARSKLFQDYQRAFAAASGLPLVIGEPDAKTSIEWPTETANPFCARLGGTINACASCREFQGRLAAAASARGSTQTRQCHAGLSETAVPVRYGNRVFAVLQFGQVRLRSLSDDEIKSVVQNLTTVSPSLDSEILAAELKATHSLAPTQHTGLVRLLEFFSLQLAEWFVRLGAAETPRPETTAVKTVMRIKEWLDAHYHQPITLSQAAKAVELSPFYLSKVMHQGTGMMFRELVVKVRLERARQLLVYENIKITEVAAAVGFQSISQFNRTFRKTTGRTATEYRQALTARQPNGHEAPRPEISSSLQINGREPAVDRVA